MFSLRESDAQSRIEIPTRSAFSKGLRPRRERVPGNDRPMQRAPMQLPTLGTSRIGVHFSRGHHSVDLGVHYTLDGNLAPLNLTRSINDDDSNGTHSSRNRGN